MPFCSGVQCNPANTYDVGFVLDVSGSIGSRDWEVEKTFTKKLARVIDISPSGGRAGVVLFNSYAYTKIKFNSYKEVVLITDGRDSGRDYDSLARQYRSRNIKIIVVGVGNVDRHNLMKLVSNSKDFYIANNFQQLDSFAENVGKTICNGMYIL